MRVRKKWYIYGNVADSWFRFLSTLLWWCVHAAAGATVLTADGVFLVDAIHWSPTHYPFPIISIIGSIDKRLFSALHARRCTTWSFFYENVHLQSFFSANKKIHAKRTWVLSKAGIIWDMPHCPSLSPCALFHFSLIFSSSKFRAATRQQ